MLLEYNKLFEELASQCGNRYLAVKYVSRLSRKLGASDKRYIVESKLITWALTGEEPRLKGGYRREMTNEEIYVDEFLSYIDDRDVSELVKHLYIMSVKSKHLVYKSEVISIERHKEARARILLRMLWFDYIL